MANAGKECWEGLGYTSESWETLGSGPSWEVVGAPAVQDTLLSHQSPSCCPPFPPVSGDCSPMCLQGDHAWVRGRKQMERNGSVL